MNANLSQSTDTRAAMVAAIRALADFVEERTDLPVPNSVHAQYSLIGADPANEETVREVAAKLGVEPVVNWQAARAGIQLADYPTSVDYAVHGFLHARGGAS